MQISPYVNSRRKRLFDLGVVVLSLPVAIPVMVGVGLGVVLTEGWPIIFKQQRVGKNGKVFDMYKFRTMRVGADREQDKYRDMNEADGPVFKIKNDPRFVGVGKWLANMGLDELPQIWNVLKGEMSLVGPRPLPVEEERKIDLKVRSIREMVKPGAVSEWVVRGGYLHLSFNQWMELDKRYVGNGTFKQDWDIIWKMGKIILSL